MSDSTGEKLDIDGNIHDMPVSLRTIITDSLSPIKEALAKIETSVTSMTKDIQDIKLSNALQQKDIDIMREQIKAQEMTISALKDKLNQTETHLNDRISEIENKDANKKAKLVDSISSEFFKKLAYVILIACIIGLCVALGVDYKSTLEALK